MANPGGSGGGGGRKKRGGRGRKLSPEEMAEMLGIRVRAHGESDRSHPHGFESEQQWRDATRPLAQAVRARTGTEDAESPPAVFIAGSAVTGRSFADKDGRPAGTPFGDHSDLDLGVASPQLTRDAIAALGAETRAPSSDTAGIEKTRALHPLELDRGFDRGLADAVGAVRDGGTLRPRETSVAFFDARNAAEANMGREFIERPHTPRGERSPNPFMPADAGAGASGSGSGGGSGGGRGGIGRGSGSHGSRGSGAPRGGGSGGGGSGGGGSGVSSARSAPPPASHAAASAARTEAKSSGASTGAGSSRGGSGFSRRSNSGRGRGGGGGGAAVAGRDRSAGPPPVSNSGRGAPGSKVEQQRAASTGSGARGGRRGNRRGRR